MPENSFHSLYSFIQYTFLDILWISSFFPEKANTLQMLHTFHQLLDYVKIITAATEMEKQFPS